MKLEEVNQRTKEAVDFLVAALESGHSAALTQYLAAMAEFRNYSFLLALNDPGVRCFRHYRQEGPAVARLVAPIHYDRLGSPPKSTAYWLPP